MLKILKKGLKLGLLIKEKNQLFLVLLPMSKVIKPPKSIQLNKKDHQLVISIFRPKLKENKIDHQIKKVRNLDPVPKMQEERVQYYLIKVKLVQQLSILMIKILSKRNNRVQRFK